MKKLFTYTLIFCMSVSACSQLDETVPEAKPQETVQIPASAYKGELLIKFAPEMSAILDEAFATSGVVTRSGIPSTDEVLAILGAYGFERVFPVDPEHEARTRESGLHLWYTVYFDEDTDLSEAVARLSQLGEISDVQCNSTIHRSYKTDARPVVLPEMKRSQAAGAVFNDEYLHYQWSYINHGNLPFQKPWAPTVDGSDVGCEAAWEKCTGNPEIIVAVLDEGVLWSHPDLINRMWVNEGEELFSDTDADNNGYIGDKYGYNFVNNSGILSSDGMMNTGHGTHVAGTIAAENGNGIGVCGIAGGGNGHGDGVRIMSCQLFDGNRGASHAASARAIKYAADNGAVILQCSWGYLSADSDELIHMFPGPRTEEEWVKMSPLDKDALDYFCNNAGSPNGVIEGGIPIFASGNEYASISSFPAAYDKCLSVSSIAADFTPAVYTNYGKEVDFCAPGGDNDYYGEPGLPGESALNGTTTVYNTEGAICSTHSNGGKPAYCFMEGTSMACPHVSGVAALGLSYALEKRMHFTAEEFIRMMKASAVDVDAKFRGKTKTYHVDPFTQCAAPDRKDMNVYLGKMGRLVNAGQLLDAIDSGDYGAPMRVPNFYVQPGEVQKIDLTRYFPAGTSSFTASGSASDVAKVTVSGHQLVVEGVAAGFTEAEVNGQTIRITVREGAADNGWL